MRPWSRYGELKDALRQLGYKLEEHLLNASDFGVPQSRRRLFLIGDREREPGFARSTAGPGPRHREVHPRRPRNLEDVTAVQPAESKGNDR